MRIVHVPVFNRRVEWEVGLVKAEGQKKRTVEAGQASQFGDRGPRVLAIVVSVVGDVRACEVIPFVAAAFGPLAGAAPRAPAARGEPRQTSARRVEVVGNDLAARTIIAFHTPEATHADSPALEVLSSVLSGGRSSRLHRGLVQGERVAAEASWK